MSLKFSPQWNRETERPPETLKRTRALPRGLLISLLAVFSAPAHPQPEQASPERAREYRQTQLFYRVARKSVNALVEFAVICRSSSDFVVPSHLF
jgi:hypothetical protein